MKVICDEYKCHWKGDSQNTLKAKNPFSPTQEVVGCPDCLELNTIVTACDHEGCWRMSSCGTPTPDGYRQTCSEHAPKL